MISARQVNPRRFVTACCPMYWPGSVEYVHFEVGPGWFWGLPRTPEPAVWRDMVITEINRNAGTITIGKQRRAR